MAIKGSFYCGLCLSFKELPLDATHCHCGQKLQYCPELDDPSMLDQLQEPEPAELKPISFQAQNEADQRRAAELVKYHENLDGLKKHLRREFEGSVEEEEE